jgi:limonene 1,2-monooxygenase
VKIGLFSNSQRFSESPTEDLEADLQELVLADELGYSEAWLSEHLGSPFAGAVTAPELLVAKAAAVTSRIRLGSAVRLLPLFHPLDIATQAATNDHLLGGRYNLGLGTGFPGTGTLDQRGIPAEDRVPRSVEAFTLVERLLREPEPFDWDGEFFRGTALSIAPRPLQQPIPPIAVASSELARLAAEGGHGMLRAHLEQPASLAKRIAEFETWAKDAGRADARSRVRVARWVVVADSRTEALELLRDYMERDLHFRARFNPGPLKQFLIPGEAPTDLTFDALAERGVFVAGSPTDVLAQINDLYQEVGGFGTLLIVAGKDWGTAQARERSLRLFAEHVAPALAELPE